MQINSNNVVDRFANLSAVCPDFKSPAWAVASEPELSDVTTAASKDASYFEPNASGNDLTEVKFKGEVFEAKAADASGVVVDTV